jgi:phosphate butyryltransferase
MKVPSINSFNDLLSRAATLPEKRVLVVMPANKETFDAIVEARTRLKTRFLLVGGEEAIRHGPGSSAAALDRIEIRDASGQEEALQICVEILRDGKADLFMKGAVDTGTMMRAVFDERSGLRTGKLLSDVFITEATLEGRTRFLMITDGGLTVAPDLGDKIHIINNAVAVAHALGNPLPKVAILSATELVSPVIPSTIDAAILTKMNDRNQIKGCRVDGPLALDNAISLESAREKRIQSDVAGQADILVAPTIEAANILAKSSHYLAGWRLAHVILGGKVPILIPSRADKSDAKLLSIALGMIMSEATGAGNS